MMSPEEFSFRPEDWGKWIKRFDRFRIVSGVSDKDEEIQVSTLIYTMGPLAEDIFTSFNLSTSDANKYSVVLKKFKGYFEPKTNVIFRRAIFNQRTQQPGESVSNFITALHSLADYCNYGSLKGELIRDRIVVGISDTKLSEKLQMNSELTLETAINMSRQTEQVHAQQSAIRPTEQDSSFSRIDKVTSVRDRAYGPKSSFQTNTQWSCYSCGSHAKHTKEECKARFAKCHKCSKTGHFAAVCQDRRRSPYKAYNEVAIVQDEDHTEYSPDSYFLGSVSNQTNARGSEWQLITELWNNDDKFSTVKFKIDSGACVTCVPARLYDANMGRLNTLQTPLYGASGHNLQTVGFVNLDMKYKDQITSQNIYFVKGLTTPLLGRPAIQSLNLFTRINSVEGDWTEIYPQLFTGLGHMKGTYSIALFPETRPFSVSSSRRVPLPLVPMVKEELDRMVSDRVIFPITKPTEWCAPMVVIPKTSGKVRICGDFTELNKGILRERYELPTIEDTLSKLSGGTVFTKLDANSGFYQIGLEEESAKLTTFITPFGRYYYKRLPMGISSAPEHYMRRMAQLTDSLPGTLCLMDDTCVVGATQEEHDTRLRKVLEVLSEEGVTLNPSKCEISVHSLKYLGYIVDSKGIHPDPAKVAGISQFPTPEDVSGVRRFLGMFNQLAKFVPHVSDHTKPLRDLLVKDTTWMWTEVHSKAFTELKDILKSASVLAHYDVNKPVILSADSSSYGLGAVLYQQVQKEWKPVAYTSRSLEAAETRYATIEKESLAITWACEHFAQYLVGKRFVIHTDHRPLVSLLQSKRLDELSVRIQRFRMRLLRFSYDIVYVPGKDQVVPDAMSRAPIHTKLCFNDNLVHEVEDYGRAIVNALPISDLQLQRVKASQGVDPIVSDIVRYCTSVWPSTDDLPMEHRIYAPLQDDLTVFDGLLLKGTRLVIPPPLRTEMLRRIHEGHQGITKCLRRARDSIWWPGITSHIKDYITNCEICCRFRLPHQEPMISSESPAFPWQKVGCDFFAWENSNYLLIVDYLSRWIESIPMKSTTSENTILQLKSVFSRYGIPQQLISDNGPQFSSGVFTSFAEDYGFSHMTSSPRYPQSNGEAERAVKTVKLLLTKAKLSTSDPYLAMLNYNSTPLVSGLSPSEMMMGRKLRTTLPLPSTQLTPRTPNWTDVREKENTYKAVMSRNYDQRRGVKQRRDFKTGDRIYLPHEQVDGTVIRRHVTPRSYVVSTPSGEKRRTKSHLLPLPAYPLQPPPATIVPETIVPAADAQPAAPLRRSERCNSGVPPARFSSCC